MRPPECAYSAPGRGTFELARVGSQSDTAATVRGFLTDIDSGAPIGPLSQVSASQAAAVVSGARADASGLLSFEVPPGTTRFEASAMGYVQVKTDSVTLPPGSIWEVQFRLHQSCPIVEDV